MKIKLTELECYIAINQVWDTYGPQDILMRLACGWEESYQSLYKNP